MIEILGLNIYEETIENKVVEIIDVDSEESDNEVAHNLYLNELEKGRIEEEQQRGSDGIENEEEKTIENEKTYKKKENSAEEALNMQ